MQSIEEKLPDINIQEFAKHFGRIKSKGTPKEYFRGIPYFFQFKMTDNVSTFDETYLCGKLSRKCHGYNGLPFIEKCLDKDTRECLDEYTSENWDGGSEQERCLPTFYRGREFLPYWHTPRPER